MSITLTPEQTRRIVSALTYLQEARALMPYVVNADQADGDVGGTISGKIVAAIDVLSDAIPYVEQHAAIDRLSLPELSDRCHHLLNALQSFGYKSPTGDDYNDLHDAILDAFSPNT